MLRCEGNKQHFMKKKGDAERDSYLIEICEIAHLRQRRVSCHGVRTPFLEIFGMPS